MGPIFYDFYRLNYPSRKPYMNEMRERRENLPERVGKMIE